MAIRGKEIKILEGDIYVKKHKLAREWIMFECEKRRYCDGAVGQCGAKLKVKGDQYIKLGEHSHAVDVGKAEMLITRNRIKRRATDTLETPQQIISDAVVNMSEGNYICRIKILTLQYFELFLVIPM